MALRTGYTDQFLSDALPVLDSLIYDEFERLPDYVPELFRVMDSSRWGEQTSTMAGIKPTVAKNEGEAVAFDDPIQGYDKTYQHITYAMACSFSEETIEDDRMNMVEDTYRSLGLSMYQTKMITCFNIYNNGFSDTGPDGSSLYNASHTLIGGGTDGNRPSTDIALSVGGIRQAEIDTLKQVNHRNINVMVMLENMVVPPDLKHVAKELLRSQDRPDTANRSMNTFYEENYKLFVIPYLTSTTAWFMGSNKSTHQFRFYNRVAPNTRSWVDDKTGDVNTRIRCRFSVGYSDWIGQWGTSG